MKKAKTEGSPAQMKPALTPEAEEQQMIALATNAAKKQLMDGTASSQVIVHYLKLGSSRAKLELEKLKNENENIKAKTKAVESEQNNEELLKKAMKAFAGYSGQGDVYEDE